MYSYIAIQNTYDIFEMALFINKTLVDHIQEDKRHTSKLFIPLLDQLLVKNNIDLSFLSFCAVNCGPGPFSTLRSVIASVNGIHFSTAIPLIGIDGLDATFIEFYKPQYHYTVILLNAFNNDVYYLIAQDKQILSKGYKKIDTFLEHIKHTYPAPVNFIGNGAILHQNLINNILGANAVIADPTPAYCSIKTIATLGLQAFETNNYTADYLMPLHLKKHAVEL